MLDKFKNNLILNGRELPSSPKINPGSVLFKLPNFKPKLLAWYFYENCFYYSCLYYEGIGYYEMMQDEVLQDLFEIMKDD